MNYNEIIETKFRIPQDAYLDEHMAEIITSLNSNPERVVIDCREVASAEAYKVLKEPTYLQEEYLNFVDDGIKILTASPNFFNKIKDHLPKTIKELTVPKECLENVDFLQEFPNLETLTLSDYSSFETDELEAILANTNIKKINFRSSSFYYKHRGEENYTMIYGGPVIGDYKGINLSYLSQGKWLKNQSAYVTTLSDLSTLKELYNEIRPSIPSSSSITLYESGTKNQVASLEINPGQQATALKFNHVEPKKAANVYHEIHQQIPVSKVDYITENKTIEDIHYLNSIAKSTDLKVAYKGIIPDAPLEEFQNMRSAIDYYKGLVTDANLSPVEQVAYVYDILKTWHYQEHSEDKQRSRTLHGIIADGTIVCVGYATFVETLLTELGQKVISIAPTIPTQDNPYAGHQRNMVRIDDDKYNIHGVFVLDATWDSDKKIAVIEEENGEKTVITNPTKEDTVVDSYNNLSLYRHFLIPLSDYDSRYPGEVNPNLVELYKNGDTKELIQKSRMHQEQQGILLSLDEEKHCKLFEPEEGKLTVEQYLTAPKPSLETFKEIITNVRQAEGYSQEDSKTDTERVVELHNMLNDQSEGQPNHFFKPTKSK